MTVTLVFLAVVATIAGWWLGHQRIAAKPWLETGTLADDAAFGRRQGPSVRVGLWIFLAVVGALFALTTSAYLMRMGLADWSDLTLPRLVWANTLVLCCASAALQMARGAVKNGDLETARTSLAVASIATIVFLIGQMGAWQALQAAGHGATANPAASFFYLVTGLHGLHILGGLAVLGRTTLKAWGADDPAGLSLSVELSALYSHFMLAVWLVLMALLTGWASDFAVICSQLFT